MFPKVYAALIFCFFFIKEKEISKNNFTTSELKKAKFVITADESSSNRFLGLIFVIENDPRTFYIIPTETLSEPDGRTFF